MLTEIKHQFHLSRVAFSILLISFLISTIVFLIDLNSFLTCSVWLSKDNLEFFETVLATSSSTFLFFAVLSRSNKRIALETAVFVAGANRYMAFSSILDRERAMIGLSGLLVSFGIHLFKNIYDFNNFESANVEIWYSGTIFIFSSIIATMSLIWLRLPYRTKKLFLTCFAEDLLSKEFKCEIYKGRDESDSIWLKRLIEGCFLFKVSEEEIKNTYISARKELLKYYTPKSN